MALPVVQGNMPGSACLLLPRLLEFTGANAHYGQTEIRKDKLIDIYIVTNVRRQSIQRNTENSEKKHGK